MTDSVNAYKAEIDYMRDLLKNNQNEMQRLQQSLQAKDKIVKSQQKKLTDIERIQKELINEYEQQVSSLKNEIGRLKLSHERLLDKFKQQKFSAHRENGENQKLLQDLNSLTCQLRVSNQRQSTLQEQIDTLESDRSRLSERCHFLQTEIVKLKMDNAETVTQLSELKFIQKNFDWKEALYEKMRDAENLKVKNTRVLSKGTQTKDQDQTEPLGMQRNTGNEDVVLQTQSDNVDKPSITAAFNLNDFIEEFQTSSDSVVDKVLEEEKDHIAHLNNRITTHLQHLEDLFLQSLR